MLGGLVNNQCPYGGMAYAAVLETVAARHVGSNPTKGTLRWSKGSTSGFDSLSGGSIPSLKTIISIYLDVEESGFSRPPWKWEHVGSNPAI